MAQKIPLPVVGEDLDPSEPDEAVKTILMAITGTTLVLGIFAVARSGFNMLAGQTDAVNEVNLQ